jgi:translation initiation factor IF-2
MSAPIDPPEQLEPLDADLQKLIEREAASHDESAVVARELQRLEARLQALPPAAQPLPPSNVVPLRPRRFAVIASSIGGALVAAAALWLLFVHPRQSSPFASKSESAAAAPAADTPPPAASAAYPASPADVPAPPAVVPEPLASAAPAAGPRQTAAAPSRSLDAGAPVRPTPKKRK